MKLDSGAPILGGDQVWSQIQFLQNFNVYAAFQTIVFWCQTAQVPLLSYLYNLGCYLCLYFFLIEGIVISIHVELWGFSELLHVPGP